VTGLLITMAECLALTVVIELSLAMAFCSVVRSRHGAAVVALVNVLTNPVVVALWFVVQVSGLPAWPCIAVLELSAVAVEAFWYRRLLEDVSRPFAMALALNLCSFVLGLFVPFT